MSPRATQKIVLGGLLVILIAAAVISVSVLDNSRAALPLYLGVAAVGALFIRVVMAPNNKRHTK